MAPAETGSLRAPLAPEPARGRDRESFLLICGYLTMWGLLTQPDPGVQQPYGFAVWSDLI